MGTNLLHALDMHELSHVIFDVFNEAHMAVACFTLAAIMLYIASTREFKSFPRKVKAFNWIILGATFVGVYLADFPGPIERSWLRFAFALLLIGELSYHGDIIAEIAGRVIEFVKTRASK